jgi:acyl dehydratase/NAD(P)-dependent dehydrogenase (short-subunit alcohol dehydrogenase family)
VTSSSPVSEVPLATRTFTESDQLAFARLTGDSNPIHVDVLRARRTQAGDVVVHGVHGALWALDKLVETDVLSGDVASIAVKFPKFILLGRNVELRVTSRSAREISAVIAIGSMVMTTLAIGLGGTRNVDDAVSPTTPPLPRRTDPLVWTRIEDIAQLQGALDVAPCVNDLGHYFPHISACIGSDRVAAIALLSTLVGMECPGLHSLFSSFTVHLTESPAARTRVGYRVNYTDDRFRIIRMAVAGAGIRGDVQAFLRPPAVAQKSIEEIVPAIIPGEFKGSAALIIGGSRGLGALTAKVIAAGGGRTIITYAKGQAEAAEIVAEIRKHAGAQACSALAYDALKEPAPQLASIAGNVSHVYYFATAVIGQQRDAPFVPDMLDAFTAMYVTGFYECCRAVANNSDRPITAFYPSTVFAEKTPLTMIEYAMAKAAGEMLCQHLNRSNCGIRAIARRLPRVLTDQTATIPPMATRDPMEVMLPLIREVQSTKANQG